MSLAELERTAYQLLDREYPVVYQGPIRRLDNITKDHSHRVAEYAEQLAILWGMSPERAKEVRIAGLLHDVGKVFADQEVLWYPGKLTDEQKEELHLHPVDSERIAILYRYPRIIRQYIRQHHEFTDGTGYPDKLRGTELTMGASFIKIADEWDRMRSVVPWRPYELSPSEAHAELHSHFGKRYPRRLAPIVDQWYERSLHAQRSTITQPATARR